MKQLEAETGKPGQGKVSVGEMYAALLAVAPKYAGIGKKDETPDGLFKDIIKKLSARGGKQKMLPPPPPDTPDVSAPPEDTPMSSSEPAASVPAASQLAPSASSAVALFSLPSAAAKMEVDDDDDPLYNGSWPLNENVGPNKEYRIAMVARI
jgi:hypothetical protein